MSYSDLFFKGKPCMLLTVLLNKSSENHNLASIVRTVNTTYAHINKLVMDFEQLQLITVRKPGRDKFITLTPKGREIAIKLNETKYILDNA